MQDISVAFRAVMHDSCQAGRVDAVVNSAQESGRDPLGRCGRGLCCGVHWRVHNNREGAFALLAAPTPCSRTAYMCILALLHPHNVVHCMAWLPMTSPARLALHAAVHEARHL